ncbi:hypothetical protein COMNV_00743 [Commensalibacter sp. Nvir]|uniref:hypothetical protein n=1 Tax=Commensalibacter sp. Nvir TaxID=3069817 RepID=UPI002D62CE27|nr:hypothetical protein COMNV_00743 [Commensalibacter sp. Nvir]
MSEEIPFMIITRSSPTKWEHFLTLELQNDQVVISVFYGDNNQDILSAKMICCEDTYIQNANEIIREMKGPFCTKYKVVYYDKNNVLAPYGFLKIVTLDDGTEVLRIQKGTLET